MYVYDGGRLTELRKAAGLKQEDIARILHVSQQSVGRWENGKSEPSLGQLYALADMYGVSLEHLINRPRPSNAVTDVAVPALPPPPPALAVSQVEMTKISNAVRRITAAARYLDKVFPAALGSDAPSTMNETLEVAATASAESEDIDG
ncbi:helix-turn-helix transcriptional regulator [Agrobacterium rubi]|nr:helix-turn-helix transcriptional regulator [Agrobacterium rubi]NTF24085.1 helix-turn-helix transcriptional regulator [Agrobacterium rubi]